MNYTQIKSSCEVNSSHIIGNSQKTLNIDTKSIKKQERVISNYSLDCDALLGNIEVGKRSPKIDTKYKKYFLKHISQYALTVDNITDRPLEKRRLQKTLSKPEFKLKLENDKLLKKINMMLCSCGRDVHFKNEEKIVDFKEYNEVRRLKGLKSCGNNATCTVCAAKLSSIRGNQLKEVMEVGRDNGRSYSLVVVTLPHQPNEPLEITLNQVIDMSRYIFNDREYKDFKELTKCRFVPGGLENMVSFKNGLVDWHPHKNYLLDFDITVPEILEILDLNNELELRMYISEMMTRLGQKYLDTNGIKKTLLVPRYVPNNKTNKIDVKAGVSASLEFSDDYISKWGLDSEMTASIYKKGRYDGSVDKDGKYKQSFHPFGLLELLDDNNIETSKEFKFQCAKAFQEFVLASRGKQWFYFGKGQIKYYNEKYDVDLQVKKDDIELLTSEDKGDIFYSLSYEEWLLFEVTPKKIAYAFSLETQNDVINYVFEEIENNRIKISEKYDCRISTYISKKRLLE